MNNSDHSVLEVGHQFFYKVGMESILDNAITNSTRNQKNWIQTNHFNFLVNALMLNIRVTRTKGISSLITIVILIKWMMKRYI